MAEHRRTDVRNKIPTNKFHFIFKTEIRQAPEQRNNRYEQYGYQVIQQAFNSITIICNHIYRTIIMNPQLKSNIIYEEFMRKLEFAQSLRKDKVDEFGEYYNGDIELILKQATGLLEEHTNRFLVEGLICNPDRTPKLDTLKAVIEEMPSCLTLYDGFYENNVNYDEYDSDDTNDSKAAKWAVYPARHKLLIHLAAEHFPESIPLLAAQAIKHGMDPERGGLLVKDRWNFNVLHSLVLSKDPTVIPVMKEIRKMGLFVEKDIEDHGLLCVSFIDGLSATFEYLMEWVADGLRTHRVDSLPLIHKMIPTGLPTFSKFLRRSMQQHPEDFGLIFMKNHKGKTACELAFDKWGTDEILDIIEKHGAFKNTNSPILSHVAKDVPKYVDVFVRKNASAVRVADERDGLYPFLTASMGRSIDHLSACYFLLTKEPTLIAGGELLGPSTEIRECEITNESL